MLRSFKWWLGFIPGLLFSLWCIALFGPIFQNISSEGLGYFLLFLTGAILILMTLLMLVLGCFRKTYPISFGLAIPLLVPDAGLFYQAIIMVNSGQTDFSGMLLFAAPGILALIVIGAACFRLRDNSFHRIIA